MRRILPHELDNLEPLVHGTDSANVPKIRAHGLLPGGVLGEYRQGARQAVHFQALSFETPDGIDAAGRVHNWSSAFCILKAEEYLAHGHALWLTENGVVNVFDKVEPEYLAIKVGHSYHPNLYRWTDVAGLDFRVERRIRRARRVR